MILKRLRRVLRPLWFFHVNLKSKLNHDMEEKGIVARDCLPPDLLHVAVQSGLQGVKAKVPFPPMPSQQRPR